MARSGLVAVLVVALVLSACGDSDEPDQAATTTATTVADTTTDEARVVNGVDLSTLELPDAEPYEEYALIEDDTAQVEVEVPTSWDDVDTSLGRRGEVEVPGVWASTDLEALNTGYSVPGTQVDLRVSTSEEDLLALLNGDNHTAEVCSTSEDYDYDDGRYAGTAELWTGCDEDDAALLQVVALRADDQYITVEVQMVDDADIDAAVQVLETFTAVDVEDSEVIDQSDDPGGLTDRELTAAVGSTVYIAIEENPSVGDDWRVLGGYDESVVSLLYEDFQSSGTEGGEAGAGGLHFFYFVALGPGSTTVEFGNCFGCFPDGDEITDTRSAGITVE
jgi:predicted secreted protein